MRRHVKSAFTCRLKAAVKTTRQNFGRSRTLTVAVFSLALVGCANLSVQTLFSHYSAALQSTHALAKQGEWNAALASLPDTPDSPILDGMERGRVAMLAGDQVVSEEALQTADAAAVEQQRAAVIQLSEGLNQVGSLLSNDNMLTYSPPDYELGFLHLYLMLDYLQKNDLEGALVEVRRANRVQEEARKLRESELEQTKNSVKQNGISDNVGAILSRYPDAGKMLSSVQNGYLFYLSGLLYEAERNLNGAFIDYNRALAVEPDNAFVAKAAMRVAFKQGRQSELKLLEKQYGKYKKPSRSQAQLVIINEQGVVNARDAWRLPLWLFDSRGNPVSYSVSLPYYRSTSSAPQKALTIDGNAVIPAQLTDVNAMAQQSLNEAMPAIAVRQVLRVVAKNEVRKSLAEQDESGVGNLVASIFNALSDQPDTRSWQTLPQTAGVYSGFYAAGQHAVTADGKTINVTLNPGQTTLLWLSRQGGNVVHWQGNLGGI
ncbi:COG3014 family protein [Enterovibrio norvegicus]|uniref:Uncharacterized protein n=1 Tax=Enterovibrio norvegicus TaxID=188144 RepID=A0A2N7L3T4_9GAMM|nr:hypothetical protein [Enterovibrio norvegicus]PMN88048.1 hypothetical protein BCT23_06385 [Enterovibrio norvegicus]